MSNPSVSIERLLALFKSLFDSHPSHIALLDLRGKILAVNPAWKRFGEQNRLAPGYDCVGMNYLRICETAAEGGVPQAREAYVGLLEVIHTGRPKFTMVYPCHSDNENRWFRMWVEPQTPNVPALIIAHKLIGHEEPEMNVDSEISFDLPSTSTPDGRNHHH
jgi:hypothetical protein